MPKIESSGSTNTTKINHKTGEVSKTSVKVNTSKEVRIIKIL